MLKHRSLPRYTVKNYSLKVDFGDGVEEDIQIINASLGGLNLQYKSNIEIPEEYNIVIHYKNYNFNLSINKRWSLQSSNQDISKSGFAVSFLSIDDYKIWLLFIKSLHQLNLK